MDLLTELLPLKSALLAIGCVSAVAVMFALLVVPNALLGRLFLGQRITPAFVLGSGIAAIGVALLFTQEYRASPATLGEVLLGAGLTLGGILSASAANIAQAMEGAKRQPLLTLLAWSMLWGVAINAALALVTVGPPSFDARPSYVAEAAELAHARTQEFLARHLG